MHLLRARQALQRVVASGNRFTQPTSSWPRLRQLGNASASFEPFLPGHYVVCTPASQGHAMRREPSTAAERLTLLRNGDHVYVKGAVESEGKTWVLIGTEDTTMGYSLAAKAGGALEFFRPHNQGHAEADARAEAGSLHASEPADSSHASESSGSVHGADSDLAQVTSNAADSHGLEHSDSLDFLSRDTESSATWPPASKNSSQHKATGGITVDEVLKILGDREPDYGGLDAPSASASRLKDAMKSSSGFMMVDEADLFDEADARLTSEATVDVSDAVAAAADEFGDSTHNLSVSIDVEDPTDEGYTQQQLQSDSQGTGASFTQEEALVHQLAILEESLARRFKTVRHVLNIAMQPAEQRSGFWQPRAMRVLLQHLCEALAGLSPAERAAFLTSKKARALFDWACYAVPKLAVEDLVSLARSLVQIRMGPRERPRWTEEQPALPRKLMNAIMAADILKTSLNSLEQEDILTLAYAAAIWRAEHSDAMFEHVQTLVMNDDEFLDVAPLVKVASLFAVPHVKIKEEAVSAFIKRLQRDVDLSNCFVEDLQAISLAMANQLRMPPHKQPEEARQLFEALSRAFAQTYMAQRDTLKAEYEENKALHSEEEEEGLVETRRGRPSWMKMLPFEVATVVLATGSCLFGSKAASLEGMSDLFSACLDDVSSDNRVASRRALTLLAWATTTCRIDPRGAFNKLPRHLRSVAFGGSRDMLLDSAHRVAGIPKWQQHESGDLVFGQHKVFMPQVAGITSEMYNMELERKSKRRSYAREMMAAEGVEVSVAPYELELQTKKLQSELGQRLDFRRRRRLLTLALVELVQERCSNAEDVLQQAKEHVHNLWLGVPRGEESAEEDRLRSSVGDVIRVIEQHDSLCASIAARLAWEVYGVHTPAAQAQQPSEDVEQIYSSAAERYRGGLDKKDAQRIRSAAREHGLPIVGRTSVEEYLNKKNSQALKIMAKELGLTVTGTKQTLVSRIIHEAKVSAQDFDVLMASLHGDDVELPVAHVPKPKAEADEETAMPVDVEGKMSREIGLKPIAEADHADLKMNVLTGLKVKDLKAVCKHLGLPVTGTKSVLTERIMSASASVEELEAVRRDVVDQAVA